VGCEILSSVELRQRLGIEDTVKVVERNKIAMVWTCFKKNDDDWVKKCVTLEVEGVRQRDRPGKTWQDVVDKDTDDLLIKLSDTLDHSEWKRMIGGNWSDRSSDVDAES